MIDSAGRIEWQDKPNSTRSDQTSDSKTAAKRGETKGKSFLLPGKKTKANLSQPPEVAWESYRYPVIKWKARPIATINGAIAQLTTTLDTTGGQFGTPIMRYQLKLFKTGTCPAVTTVEMHDANGFKLSEFYVAGGLLHPISGTEIMEAADATIVAPEIYKQFAEYTVDCR